VSCSDIFSLGFGPFRWVCCSGDPEDLRVTDAIAAKVMEEALGRETDEPVAAQLRDNLRWIKEAEQHGLVVGSQARILYTDAMGRVDTALAFNQAIQQGKIKVRTLNNFLWQFLKFTGYKIIMDINSFNHVF